ncbi:10618_t:CDS:10 [Diversispora eburnea]|uniref:10618_t:CDS:1 n=1 Tax=Diversispora eburnea TaxID=1213867 RepID=A0A9N8Z8G4_9GLOM|nr:10618_t:CDS:10 [Diversispora eburnea]
MPSTDRQTALDLFKSSVELEDKLRQVSKQKPPYDKEVTTLRINLRDHYERIIFLDFEFSQSKEIEQILWKYVYYKFIEDYRKRIRAASTNSGKPKGTSRRLTSAFRSFLQEATGFYYFFIQKLARHFGLEQLNPIIQKFGSTLESTDFSKDSYNFDIKQRAVLSCHKSLIFLGDLARYRELQNDKPRKNWSTACDYYNSARQLIPDSGNPHNQLAVIATYSVDEFAAFYHYYRSLAVRYPFLTAKDNISFLFQKAKKSAIDTPESVHENNKRDQRENGSRRRSSHSRQMMSPVNANKMKTAETLQPFFSDFIRLHSILYLKTDIESYSELKTSVLKRLKEFLLERVLDVDQLLKFTVINMAALYVIRHISNVSTGENGHTNSSPKTQPIYNQASKKALVEKYAVLMILGTLSTLLEMCNSELIEVENTEERRNAVQALPAPVKRSLMSIRVGVKWVYSNLEYLASMSTQISNDPFVKDEFSNFAKFWDQFAEFLNTMERLFPNEQGIPLDVPLTEDVELNGFSVLKNQLFLNDQVITKVGEPFEEMDMRVHNIYDDACKIAKSDFSQIFYADGTFSSNTLSGESNSASPVSTSSAPENQVSDDTYMEDRAAGTNTIADAERDDTNAAGSQSFVDSILLNQVFTSNQKTSSTLPNGSSNDSKNYWNNYFNTQQLFPSTNAISDDPLPFSISNTTTGVPNASQDPLVSPKKRSSNELKAKASSSQQNPITSTSSASLFAFPGTDGGVSQFDLFGNSNTGLHNYLSTSTNPSIKPNVITPAINPPPGFLTESNNYDFQRQNQKQNDSFNQPFQTSNAFGFSSFDLLRWNEKYKYTNELTDLSNNGNQNLTPTAKLPNGTLPSSQITNDTHDKFRHFQIGWTPTSIG